MKGLKKSKCCRSSKHEAFFKETMFLVSDAVLLFSYLIVIVGVRRKAKKAKAIAVSFDILPILVKGTTHLFPCPCHVYAPLRCLATR